MEKSPVVFVVDDDPNARESIASMLANREVAVETFTSAEEFLARFDRSRHGCLIVDVRMTGMGGLELQERLEAEGIYLPVIVVTGYPDISTAVACLRKGAVTFLEKPCAPAELWEGVCSALDRHRNLQERLSYRATLRTRFDTLTDQERQVYGSIVAGKPNKAIAAELSVGLRTVELRRARILKKMGAKSLVELVQIHLELHDETDGQETS